MYQALFFLLPFKKTSRGCPFKGASSVRTYSQYEHQLNTDNLQFVFVWTALKNWLVTNISSFVKLAKQPFCKSVQYFHIQLFQITLSDESSKPTRQDQFALFYLTWLDTRRWSCSPQHRQFDHLVPQKARAELLFSFIVLCRFQAPLCFLLTLSKNGTLQR